MRQEVMWLKQSCGEGRGVVSVGLSQDMGSGANRGQVVGRGRDESLCGVLSGISGYGVQ